MINISSIGEKRLEALFQKLSSDDIVLRPLDLIKLRNLVRMVDFEQPSLRQEIDLFENYVSARAGSRTCFASQFYLGVPPTELPTHEANAYDPYVKARVIMTPELRSQQKNAYDLSPLFKFKTYLEAVELIQFLHTMLRLREEDYINEYYKGTEPN